eukprot:12191-Eustigmatos_ZCMA.PRE.1
MGRKRKPVNADNLKLYKPAWDELRPRGNKQAGAGEVAESTADQELEAAPATQTAQSADTAQEA